MEEDTAARVQEILNKATEEIKSVRVDREIELGIDVGNLVASDTNTVDESLIKNPKSCDEYLCSLARDGIQALFAKVWDLPSHRTDNAVYVTLPKPSTRIPREKPLPKAPVLSRWEQYAKEKGITRRKKEKKLWDETLKRWVPRYGFRKVQAEKEKTWVIEVPDNADPYEDQFEKRAGIKKENIAKNEFQRLRNIARRGKVEVPKVGVTGSSFATPKELNLAMHHAKHATASAGKFQETLPGEKKARGLGKKWKEEFTTGDGQLEKKRCLEILSKIDKQDLNLEEAIHHQIRDENVDMDKKKEGGKKYDRRSKMGGRHMTKSDHKTVKTGKGFTKISKEKRSRGKKGKKKKVGGKYQSAFKKSKGAGSKGGKKGGQKSKAG